MPSPELRAVNFAAQRRNWRNSALAGPTIELRAFGRRGQANAGGRDRPSGRYSRSRSPIASRGATPRSERASPGHQAAIRARSTWTRRLSTFRTRGKSAEKFLLEEEGDLDPAPEVQKRSRG